MASNNMTASSDFRGWFLDKLLMGMSWSEYTRSLATPFNLVCALILAAAAPVFFIRYTQGLATVVHASSEYPWGILLSWGIFAGEPMFACGFVVCAGYYIFGMKGLKPMVRLSVIGGMLGYAFAATYLLIDLGRPWRLPYPMIMGFGPSSILFVVAWHVVLYVNVQILEFTPALLEWLGSKRVHKWAVSVTFILIVAGIILSTVHQSALGAMYLLTPGKLHPLWYSANIPILFLSSTFHTAMSFIIVMAAAGVWWFKDKADAAFLNSVEPVTVTFSKGAAISLYVYFALKMLTMASDTTWENLLTPYGYWYLFEVVGFILLPGFLFTIGARSRSLGLIRFTAIMTIWGTFMNRVNVNLIAYNWNLPDHLHHIIPPWTELAMVAAMITLHILVFRWFLNRMPILREYPEYKGTH